MKDLARGRALFAVIVSLLMSCATATRAPTRAGAGGRADVRAPDAGGEEDADSEEDEVADTDGDPEATSELAAGAGPCPRNMVIVASGEARFCVDKYEASLVEVDPDGTEKPYAHWLPVDGHTVRAVSEPGVFPQGFISEVQAEDACAASAKRLCSFTEWKTACMGPEKTTFPYGATRSAGVCHDSGRSAVAAVFGLKALGDPVAVTTPRRPGPATHDNTHDNAHAHARAPALTPASGRSAAARALKNAPSSARASTSARAPSKPNRPAHAVKGSAAETTRPRAIRSGAPTPARTTRTKKTPTRRAPARASARPASVEPSVWTRLNDARLGQVEGALSPTGSHEGCVNGYGAVDMVGNLHEWVKTDPAAPHGTFAGGYYLDTSLNGDGCQYRTTAHAHDYHDYSTGFRCCAEPKSVDAAP